MRALQHIQAACVVTIDGEETVSAMLANAGTRWQQVLFTGTHYITRIYHSLMASNEKL
ncbi:MAG TPA: hypothetical protein VG847_00115 [Chitinophagaceae bacterium]|nr:hypothetical protein [Chitinophagaceae bacterium]